MLAVHMLDVMRSGSIAGVGVGASRREAAARLGEPDAWNGGGGVWSRRANLWMYGDLELHFGVEANGRSALWMIWCDYIPMPMRPSARLRVDPWVLREPPEHRRPHGEPRSVPSSRLLTALHDAGVPYDLIQNSRPYTDHRLEVVLASGGRFGIGSRGDDDPDQGDIVLFLQVAAPHSGPGR
ncbi:MAG: hypothetical protein KC636_20775 [Myxococcales bacterium]|nr:hypothetical protein [Myxococcales bacterium]